MLSLSILEAEKAAQRVSGNLYDPEFWLEWLETSVFTPFFSHQTAGCRDILHLAFIGGIE